MQVYQTNPASPFPNYATIYYIELEHGSLAWVITQERPAKGVKVGSYVYWGTWVVDEWPGQVDLVCPLN